MPGDHDRRDRAARDRMHRDPSFRPGSLDRRVRAERLERGRPGQRARRLRGWQPGPGSWRAPRLSEPGSLRRFDTGERRRGVGALLGAGRRSRSAAPSPETENRWPDPSYRTTPAAVGSSITGRAPLKVLYNLCRSQDPDGDGLFFRMDLDGNGSYEHFGTTGADCSHEATYAVGTRTVALCVTDGYCPAWPLCEDLPRWRFHPYQCMSYEVSATP